MPLLEQMCRRIEHVGELGSGSMMKLAVNLPLLVYWQALGEALTICKPLNLPAERLIDILTDTSGAPTAMKGRGPAIAKVLVERHLARPHSSECREKGSGLCGAIRSVDSCRDAGYVQRAGLLRGGRSSRSR